MILKNLLQNLDEGRFENLEISGISRDSRTVKKGDLYFCLSTEQTECERRCQEALEKGAKAVVTEVKLPFSNSITVKDVRHDFALSCKNFYDRACERLTMIGVTGTNGKTTTVRIVAEVLNRSGRKAGVIGTSGVFYNGKHFESPLTTPDADFLHKTFKEMLDDGVEYVVMEISAHAMEQKRIDGIIFDTAVLTNITQDHLDYFKTFENYKNTKLSFFDKDHIKKAIICGDDEFAKEVLNCIDMPVQTYGIQNPCDVFAMNVFCSINGSKFLVNLNDESILDIKTNLIGKYNVYNALAGLCVCKQLGLDDMELANGLNFLEPVEGRFTVACVDGKYIVIDYAHTPDGLENVLTSAKSLTDKKVHLVFGCGGNRDKDKRHKMGQIAEQIADSVCLTNDNPRTENPEEIIADIESGMQKPHYVQPDRTKAIKMMVEKAEEGDIVIIAGKGAEKYQEFGDTKIPYNDFETVYQLFQDKNSTKNRGKQI